MAASGLEERADGSLACWWGEGYGDLFGYHDDEWGVPVVSDVRLYEKMCLEGFQSGLSWLTILKKRENFREAFAGFDFEQVASFTDADVERLLQNAGIIRHRGKIEATINNARAAFGTIEEHGSLAAFFWSFEPGEDARPARLDEKSLLALTQTEASRAMAKALKARGFKFFGPTTAYAFMQSMGIVNDHAEHCDIRDVAERARAKFERPKPKRGAVI